MSEQGLANELAALLRLDFGFDTPKTHVTKPIQVGSRMWTFTLIACRGHQAQRWVAEHVRIGSLVRGAFNADLVTNLELSLVTAAYSVVAINNVSLWRVFERSLQLSDAERDSINDPLFPPENIRRRASAVFLDECRRGEGLDRSVLTWLFDEHNRVFEGGVVLPDEALPEDTPFKCSECHYITNVPADRTASFEEMWESAAATVIGDFRPFVHCMKCGSKAYPPPDATEDPESLLGKRYGSVSERTPTSTS